MGKLGHGHVNPRPDGVKARCGGPLLCQACREETFLTLTPADKLRTLYESEINWELSCFYDGGYIARLGDAANGFTSIEDGFHETIGAAVEWLWLKAKETYPKAMCFNKDALL